MAASSSSDIPDWKSKYCPCKGCGVAREEGRQEVMQKLLKIASKYGIDLKELDKE